MYQIEPEDFEYYDFVKKSLDEILSFLSEKRDFSVTFVTDEEIRSLNNEYRSIDAPTDILTFRLADGDDDFPSSDEELGDIFISSDMCRKNAEEFGVEYLDELKRLLLHGILHLRGKDHKTNDFKTEPMLIEQERILEELKERETEG